MKYRKKPVVIEAIQWDGTYDSMQEIETIFPNLDTVRRACNKVANTVSYWKIGTFMGGRKVSPGDFIIKDVQGELYPCKPGIFEAIYEPLPDEERSEKEADDAKE